MNQVVNTIHVSLYSTTVNTRFSVRADYNEVIIVWRSMDMISLVQIVIIKDVIKICPKRLDISDYIIKLAGTLLESRDLPLKKST